MIRVHDSMPTWEQLAEGLPVLQELERDVRVASVETGSDMGRPYATWRRRLESLNISPMAFEIAHRHLIDVYEGHA